jgi:DNA invertase Pin-like site-specific DNA recombinase
MLGEIKAERINCIIVKDLSRFGRSYLEAGNYLENVFPKYNCRFISVIDGIDTYTNPESVNDIMVWIKNMMHEYNSQRISVNVRATKRAQQKAGKYISPRIPYGYKKNPDNKHRLIVDEEVRPIIENIYRWYLKGMGVTRVAKKLNELGITTRAVYRKTGSLYTDGKTIGCSSWNPDSVTEILTSKTYIGAVVQHKRTTQNYKDRRVIRWDEKDQIIVYDQHEPIISKDIFAQVQEIRKKYCTKTSPNENRLYVLSGLLRCKDCGHAMIRNPKFAKGKWYVYYRCRGNNQRGMTVCTHNHSIREEEVIQSTIAAINMQIETLIDVKKLIERISIEGKLKRTAGTIDFEKLIGDKKRQMIRFRNNKIDCYNDWKDGVIDKRDYMMFKDKYDESLKKLSDEICALENENMLQEDIFDDELNWLNNIVEFGRITELTREIAVSLIDIIYVDKNKQLTIDFKFKNEFETLIRVIADMGYLNTTEMEVGHV